MGMLGKELLDNRELLIQRWYERWRASPAPQDQISERQLKDKLPVQLRIIGEQLLDFNHAESPWELWQVKERLDPELRVDEKVPIQEVVLGYNLFIQVFREWIEEKEIEVTFMENAYFYDSFFQLIAEVVRRYTAYQAEAVSKERSEYLAGITHQMRSPLTALSFLAQRMGLSGKNLEGDALEGMQRNINRLRLLVDGVMRLERFKPHELPVRCYEVQPADIIDEILVDNESEAVRKGLRLEASGNRDLKTWIDPELFRDALGNLVDNAVKYTETGFVRIEIEEQEHDILYKVTDSGPGISEKRRKELFSPVLPEKRGGVGIGLTIVHRAVTAQGGEAGVRNMEEGGSQFWFRLPRKVTTGSPGEG